MPTSVGPNTKGEENLVFAYDLGDVSNSYKGEPTSNVVNDPAPSSAWGISNYNSTSTRSYGVDEDGNPMLIIDVTSVGSGYPRSVGPFLLSTITGTFSTSFEAKAATNGINIALKIYENGSTKVTNTANLTTEWQRFTFDNQSTGFTLDRPYFNPVNNGTYYIRKIQIEAKSHSTPYVNGTRSATQGLLDLTGNSTIDLSNVSFDSNAQMTFDGTNDKVELSSYLTTLDTSVLSLEFVFRTNIGTGTIQPLLGWHYGRAGHGYVCLGSFTGHWGDESISFYNEGTGATPLSFAYTNGHSFLGDTNYHHAVIVLQTGNYRIFVDGEEVAVNESFRNGSQSTVMQSNLFGYGTEPKVGIGVGSQTERYFNGRIPITKLYSRALTAEEIKSNFNAIKGRFNIL